jgi:hypothetical protein
MASSADRDGLSELRGRIARLERSTTAAAGGKATRPFGLLCLDHQLPGGGLPLRLASRGRAGRTRAGARGGCHPIHDRHPRDAQGAGAVVPGLSRPVRAGAGPRGLASRPGDLCRDLAACRGSAREGGGRALSRARGRRGRDRPLEPIGSRRLQLAAEGMGVSRPIRSP